MGVCIISADCFLYCDHGFTYESLKLPKIVWSSKQAAHERDQFIMKLLGPVLKNSIDLQRLIQEMKRLNEDEESQLSLDIAEERFQKVPYGQIDRITWLRKFLAREGLRLYLLDHTELIVRPGFYSPWGFVVGRGAEVEFRKNMLANISLKKQSVSK